MKLCALESRSSLRYTPPQRDEYREDESYLGRRDWL